MSRRLCSALHAHKLFGQQLFAVDANAAAQVRDGRMTVFFQHVQQRQRRGKAGGGLSA